MSMIHNTRNMLRDTLNVLMHRAYLQFSTEHKLGYSTVYNFLAERNATLGKQLFKRTFIEALLKKVLCSP